MEHVGVVAEAEQQIKSGGDFFSDGRELFGEGSRLWGDRDIARIGPLVGVLTGGGKERGHTRRGMNMVIIGEFGEWQPLRPVVLVVVHVDTEVRFKFLFAPFGLPVGLGVIGRRRVATDDEKVEKVAHKGAHKLGAAVADNFARESVMANDVVTK